MTINKFCKTKLEASILRYLIISSKTENTVGLYVMLQNQRNALQDTWCKMCDTLNTDPAFLQMMKLIIYIYIMVEGK